MMLSVVEVIGEGEDVGVGGLDATNGPSAVGTEQDI